MTYLTFTELILAAEQEGGSGLDLVLPERSELIAGIIAFAIVFFFVRAKVWPAMNKLVDERQRAIAGQLEDAEKTKLEAQSLLEDYRQQLANAKSEANEIVENARTQADSVRADIIAKAEAEAEEIRSKARDDAGKEKERALTEARQEVANLSIDLAEKVVGDNLDRDAQKSLVDRYLADLERMSE